MRISKNNYFRFFQFFLFVSLCTANTSWATGDGGVCPTCNEKIPTPDSEGKVRIISLHHEILSSFKDVNNKIKEIEDKYNHIEQMLNNKERRKSLVMCSTMQSMKSDIQEVENKLRAFDNKKLNDEEFKKLTSSKELYKKAYKKMREVISSSYVRCEEEQ